MDGCLSVIDPWKFHIWIQYFALALGLFVEGKAFFAVPTHFETSGHERILIA